MKPRIPDLSPDILEQASDWFVDFSQDDIDAEDRHRFDAWLRRSPEHVRAYLQITAFWEDASAFGKGRTLASEDLVARALSETNVVPLGEPRDRARASRADKAGESASSSTPAAGLPEGGTPGFLALTTSGLPRRGTAKSLALVASVLIVVAGAGAYFYTQRGTYSAGIGEQRSIALDDGSAVDINSRTTIRIRFTGRERNVQLVEGQALFRVAKDRARPFIVDSNGTQVRAVGTQFDVYRRKNGTTVTVIEGRVAVHDESGGLRLAEAGPHHDAGRVEPAASPIQARAGEILVAAGEQLTARAQGVAAPEAADIGAATAWTRRQLVFHSTPLSEVIEEFNRYNPRQLTLVDSKLNSVRISGIFASTDAESFLRFLKELPDLSIEEAPGEIRIHAKAK